MARRKRRKRRYTPRESGFEGETDDDLDDDAIALLINALEEFPVAYAQRGHEYWRESRVGPVSVAEEVATAVVRGERNYHVFWYFCGTFWAPDCDCPLASSCKHQYAVGLSILNGYQAELDDDTARRATHLLTYQPGTTVASATSGAALPAPAAASSVGPLVGGFSSADTAVEMLRTSTLVSMRRTALAQLLAARPASSHLIYEVPGELNESDPDMRCFRLARAIARKADGWVPAALHPYLERRDLAAQVDREHQLQVQRRLAAWLAEQPGAATQTFRAELVIDRGFGGLFEIYIVVRASSPRLEDLPRALEQLRQAWTRVERNDAQMVAEQRILLQWVVSSLDGAYHHGTPRLPMSRTMLHSLVQFDNSPLITWSPDIDPALASRAGIAAGSPIRYFPQAASLQPHYRTIAGEARVGLSFFWPDGSSRSMHECLRVTARDFNYRGADAFLVRDGAISPAVMDLPNEIISLFAETPEIPVEPSLRETLLRGLAGRFRNVEVELARHTRFHDVVPVFALDLREDDWMQIRLFAAATGFEWTPGQPAQGGTVFEFAPFTGWIAVADASPDTPETFDVIDDGTSVGTADAGDFVPPDEPPADKVSIADEDVWDDSPDPRCVAASVEWLRLLDAHPGDKGRRESPWPDKRTGWWMFTRGKGMLRFSEAWAAVPAGVRFFGTAAVRRLLDRGRRVVPRVKVQPSGLDWFEVSASWQAEGMQLSDDDVSALRRATTNFVRLPSGWVRREIVDEQDEAAQLLADLGVEANEGPARLSVLALAGAQPETIDALARFGADDETLSAVKRLRVAVAKFDGVPKVRVPRRFHGELRPYQRAGLDFLAHASSLQLGVILADDMGLGKTIQALAWLQWLRDRDPKGGPSLIVCPASVTHNWLDEAAQFTPNLRVLVLSRGTQRRKQMADVPACDLVITNYALLRRDIEIWRDQPLRSLVLDEAQNIKNPGAEVTRALRSVQAKHRVALTGTPIENRALDLWSIADCINPGYLGSQRDFAARFDGLDRPPHRRALLSAKLRPILLRRTKAEVAPELPDRIEESRWCEMTPGQRRLYLAELSRSRALVDDLADDPDGLRKNKITILAALTRLRQICCHPALAGGKQSLGSGKFEALFDLLEPLLAEGHKVLLFSQFVESLKLLRADMTKRDIRHHILTGQTTKRAEVVRAFHEDAGPCVFLISLKAGGTGLNLTSASYVVLFDPWWNPAVEAQAIDRTHRIGQSRTVIAYRLITEGTIEEKIRELQRQKECMVRDVLGESGFARSLTRDDLAYILETP